MSDERALTVRQKRRDKQLQRVGDRIDSLDRNIQHLTYLTPVLTLVAVIMLVMGQWVPMTLVTVGATASGFMLKGSKSRLKALESEETYLIEAEHLDD